MSRFVIPKPWQTGLAIPDNMKAEGLRSGAYVTEWAPRGTYDDPDAFDPSWDKSYAVPDYILAEGYGQGAQVTEWAARGSYVGQTPSVTKLAKKIARTQVALGDTDAVPAPFANYGRRAAAAIMAQVMTLPPPARKDAIRKTLNAIDPTLYSRAEQHANKFVARGADAATALTVGLAKAMSSGIATEIVDVGKKGRRPAARGQVGLGCYGKRGVLSALGDSPVSKAIATITGLPAAPVATAAVNMPPGTCSADGKSIWALTDTGTGYWRRRTATDVCVGTSTSGPEQHTGAQGGTTVSGGTKYQILDLGPIKIPLGPQFNFLWQKALPAEWQGAISAEIGKDTAIVGTNLVDAAPGKIWNRLRDFVPNMPARVNQDFIGLYGVQEALLPFVRTTRPDNGEEWGLYLTITQIDPKKPWDSTTNPYILQITWKKTFGTIFDWILKVIGKIIDFVGDVLDTVGDLACSLLQSPVAGVAAGAAAASQGVPPATGVQGAQIAAGACQTTPPPSSSGDDDGILLPLAIAGGAVVALAFLLPKKKKTP